MPESLSLQELDELRLDEDDECEMWCELDLYSSDLEIERYHSEAKEKYSEEYWDYLIGFYED